MQGLVLQHLESYWPSFVLVGIVGLFFSSPLSRAPVNIGPLQDTSTAASSAPAPIVASAAALARNPLFVCNTLATALQVHLGFISAVWSFTHSLALAQLPYPTLGRIVNVLVATQLFSVAGCAAYLPKLTARFFQRSTSSSSMYVGASVVPGAGFHSPSRDSGSVCVGWQRAGSC